MSQTNKIEEKLVAEEKKKELTVMNLETFAELETLLEKHFASNSKMEFDWNAFYLGKSFKVIYKNIENTDELLGRFKEKYITLMYELMPIYVGACFYKKQFQQIYSLIKNINLSGEKKEYDLFMSKIIGFYYWACVELNKYDINEFHSLKVKNTQYNNPHSILVIKNILLDFYINNKIEYLKYIVDDIVQTDNFIKLNTFNTEKSLHCFYLGFSFLVLGNYSESLKYFDEADILNRKKSMELNIIKCSIVCKLLMGDMNIVYDYRKELSCYFALIGIVKRGEVNSLEELLKTNYDELNKRMKLLPIIQRLKANVLKEGIVQISQVYSKISIDDVNEIFKQDVSCLVHKLVLENEINSEIIHHNEKYFLVKKENLVEKKMDRNINEEIKRIIEIREFIKKQMVYSDTPVLTYERLMEEEKELLEKYEV